ncbi:sensor histidine kinase NtrY-like [Halodurantibacterium flavum]|uniref:histidine kinase n=1 Tax=Halodurantibacterium flavum TaxID=1382802 RepID=A0ABW4S7P5_9RHOB
MQRAGRILTWQQIDRLRRMRRVQNGLTLGLVLLAPVLVAATLYAFGPFGRGTSSMALRLIVLADLVYILLVATLVLSRVARMIADRRRRSAGSRLHLRLTGIFASVALVPTVLVAVFAVFTINIGLEGWFSDRVRQVVGASLAAAEAYEGEHRRDLTQDTQALAGYLVSARRASYFMSDGDLRQLLTQGQAQIQRGLREAFVIDGAGEIRARGERSYLFDFEEPTAAEIARADAGEIVIIEDWTASEFRALARLPEFVDRYLYVSRTVDASILSLLDDTQESARLYQQLERERGRLMFEFALLYLGFAVILILASIWAGLWLAERLARPVGRLAAAAERVGDGDLNQQVPEEKSDDEIATLGRAFNEMTRQLRHQRATLLDNTRQIEERRRLFDSVLSSVTAGVIGLDAAGGIEFANPSALRLLELPDGVEGRHLAEAVPEFAPLLERLQESGQPAAQEELRLSRAGRLENLLVRMAVRRAEANGDEGHVVVFDDVTDLVSAQRMAAWGDVARRIAHEIKNPLTPIQLSAERIKRKFRLAVGDQAPDLEQLSDVIIRQTNDLRRIVDEFSKFARMPEPDRRSHDIVKLARDAVVLQEGALHGAQLTAELPPGEIVVEIDATMISQALGNLIKNAGEAIETLTEAGAPEGYRPEVRVTLDGGDDMLVIRVMDNGVGLPEDRARLFEPYVTTREKGTGLGLPIVRKIIEEHGGTLILADAPVYGGSDRPGAMAEIRLPRLRRREKTLRKAV